MANRLMSAYGNLASARTDIGRNLSDIAGIGIEMEYGPEGRIAGGMEQSRIKRETEAIGLGLESIQQFASMGVSAGKEAARAKEMGELAGTGSLQTKGETRLWDLFRGKADIDTAGGETFWGEVGERIGTGLGFIDREYEIGGRRYTSPQIEAGSPWAKLGKDWKEVSQLMGGGTDSPESRWKGTFRDLGITESEFDNLKKETKTLVDPVPSTSSGGDDGTQISIYQMFDRSGFQNPFEGLLGGGIERDWSGRPIGKSGEGFSPGMKKWGSRAYRLGSAMLGGPEL